MSQECKSATLSPASSEWGPNHEVAVILAAAFGHSNESVRSALRARLETWIRQRQPLHEAHAIAQVLLEESGTALEPFCLSGDHLALAVLAVQATLSETADWQSVRIVSEETIGVEGGLVLSRSLARRYYERFALADSGSHCSKIENIPYIAPAEVLTRRKPPGVSSTRATEAWMSITETGFTIRITFDGPRGFGAIRNGDLSGSSTTLQRWGIWTKANENSVLVGSTNTDTFLKLSAHLMDRPVLRLAVGDNTGLYVQLQMPESERTKLPALVLWNDPLAASCSLGCNFNFPLTVAERLSIASEFQPPSQWITSEFLEAWSETV